MDTENNKKMYQAGLVLEGGGMKGAYTAGVLDAFLERGLEFSSVYGVSAGIITGTSFISGEKKRDLKIWRDHLGKDDYCSVKSLLTTGDLFNVQLDYHTIPDKLNPFDYQSFRQYQGKVYAVVTNIVTGEAEYLRIRDMKEDMDIVRASSSLPLVARNVPVHGKLYLDGGISDAIPVRKSIQDGNRKNIVILTKEEGYVRQPAKKLPLIRMRYRKYPKVYELMKNRHIRYNDTLSYLSQQERNGTALVIRPGQKSDIGRIEKDMKKLTALYEEGYRDGLERTDEVIAYLESE